MAVSGRRGQGEPHSTGWEEKRWGEERSTGTGTDRAESSVSYDGKENMGKKDFPMEYISNLCQKNQERYNNVQHYR